VAPYAFGGLAAVGGVAALIAALLSGSPSAPSHNSQAPARLFAPHASATASGVVIHSGPAPATSPPPAPTAPPPKTAPRRASVPSTTPGATLSEDSQRFMSSRPAYRSKTVK
jgi:hypothetical protein